MNIAWRDANTYVVSWSSRSQLDVSRLSLKGSEAASAAFLKIRRACVKGCLYIACCVVCRYSEEQQGCIEN